MKTMKLWDSQDEDTSCGNCSATIKANTSLERTEFYNEDDADPHWQLAHTLCPRCAMNPGHEAGIYLPKQFGGKA